MQLNEIAVSVTDKEGHDHVFRFRPLTVRERFVYKPKAYQSDGAAGGCYDLLRDKLAGCDTLPDLKIGSSGATDEQIGALCAAFGEWPLIGAALRYLQESDLQAAQKKP